MRLPLDPVTVIVYEPGVVLDEVEMVRVVVTGLPDVRFRLLLDKLMIGGLMVMGDWLVERLTVPVKPLRLVTVIVELAAPPSWMLNDVGFADMEKSGLVFTETRMAVEWEREPLVPVTVIV